MVKKSDIFYQFPNWRMLVVLNKIHKQLALMSICMRIIMVAARKVPLYDFRKNNISL